MFGPFGGPFIGRRFSRFSPGFFPGFGFGGVSPTYYPYLVANGWGGSCGCGPFFSPFSPFTFSPFSTFPAFPFRTF